MGNGTMCVDYPECTLDMPCGLDSMCEELPGGYNCTCSPGFTGDGEIISLVCPLGGSLFNQGKEWK